MESATESLRRLLDERGVEWWHGISEKSTVFDGEYDVRYEVDGTLGLLFIRSALHVTPEQAIAATLGRGRLTADDVRDLIERYSDASGGNGRDFHNGAYVAIADDLNATLGDDGLERSKNGVAERGTCRMERASWDDGTCTWGCICSACGKKFEHETSRGWHYCPKCGAEVVE